MESIARLGLKTDVLALIDKPNLKTIQQSNLSVLIIFACPMGVQHLRLQNEERAIREALMYYQNENIDIELSVLPACTIDDLSGHFLRTKKSYDIVHFSGHTDRLNLILRQIISTMIETNQDLDQSSFRSAATLKELEIAAELFLSRCESTIAEDLNPQPPIIEPGKQYEHTETSQLLLSAVIGEQSTSDMVVKSSKLFDFEISKLPVVLKNGRSSDIGFKRSYSYQELLEIGVGSLTFEGESGRPVFIPTDAFAELVARQESTKCVLLNACTSFFQADRLRKVVPMTVYFEGKVTEVESISFSRGFYSAIASGFGLEQAYVEGRSRMHLNSFLPGVPARALGPGARSIVNVFFNELLMEARKVRAKAAKSGSRFQDTTNGPIPLRTGSGSWTSPCVGLTDLGERNPSDLLAENAELRRMIECGITMMKAKDQEIQELKAEKMSLISSFTSLVEAGAIRAVHPLQTPTSKPRHSGGAGLMANSSSKSGTSSSSGKRMPKRSPPGAGMASPQASAGGFSPATRGSPRGSRAGGSSSSGSTSVPIGSAARRPTVTSVANERLGRFQSKKQTTVVKKFGFGSTLTVEKFDAGAATNVADEVKAEVEGDFGHGGSSRPVRGGRATEGVSTTSSSAQQYGHRKSRGYTEVSPVQRPGSAHSSYHSFSSQQAQTTSATRSDEAIMQHQSSGECISEEDSWPTDVVYSASPEEFGAKADHGWNPGAVNPKRRPQSADVSQRFKRQNEDDLSARNSPAITDRADSPWSYESVQIEELSSDLDDLDLVPSNRTFTVSPVEAACSRDETVARLKQSPGGKSRRVICPVARRDSQANRKSYRASMPLSGGYQSSSFQTSSPLDGGVSVYSEPGRLNAARTSSASADRNRPRSASAAGNGKRVNSRSLPDSRVDGSGEHFIRNRFESPSTAQKITTMSWSSTALTPDRGQRITSLHSRSKLSSTDEKKSSIRPISHIPHRAVDNSASTECDPAGTASLSTATATATATANPPSSVRPRSAPANPRTSSDASLMSLTFQHKDKDTAYTPKQAQRGAPRGKAESHPAPPVPMLGHSMSSGDILQASRSGSMHRVARSDSIAESNNRIPALMPSSSLRHQKQPHQKQQQQQQQSGVPRPTSGKRISSSMSSVPSKPAALKPEAKCDREGDLTMFSKYRQSFTGDSTDLESTCTAGSSSSSSSSVIESMSSLSRDSGCDSAESGSVLGSARPGHDVSGKFIGVVEIINAGIGTGVVTNTEWDAGDFIDRSSGDDHSRQDERLGQDESDSTCSSISWASSAPNQSSCGGSSSSRVTFSIDITGCSQSIDGKVGNVNGDIGSAGVLHDPEVECAVAGGGNFAVGSAQSGGPVQAKKGSSAGLREFVKQRRAVAKGAKPSAAFASIVPRFETNGAVVAGVGSISASSAL